jgi:ATP-dependent DNA ligase
MSSFDLLRRRQRDHRVFLYAFDLIELGGEDRRRDALAHRKVGLKPVAFWCGPRVIASAWVE